jgi:flagellin-like hook-associated protein FlgL
MIGSIGSSSSSWYSSALNFSQSVAPIAAKWSTKLALNALGDLAKQSSGVSPYKLNPAAAMMMDTLESEWAVQSQSLIGAGYADAKAQIADSSLSQVNSLLTTVQTDILSMADGTMTDSQKAAKQLEIQSALQTIDMVGNTTTFLGQKLLDGNPITYNSNTNPNNAISYTPPKVSTASLGNDTGKLSDLSTLLSQGNYEDAMDIAKSAQSTIVNGRAAGGNFMRAVEVQRSMTLDQMESTASLYNQAAATVYSSKLNDDSSFNSTFLRRNASNVRYQIFSALLAGMNR